MRTSGYQSEFTQFLTELQTQHPDLGAQQQHGRQLLWGEVVLTLDESARLRAGQVAQAPYVYQTV